MPLWGPFVSQSWGNGFQNGTSFLEDGPLPRLIYVRSVFDAVDVQDVVFNVEGEQHAIVAAPCRSQAKQFIREGFAQPTGIVGQRAGDEFNDRCCWLPGKPAGTPQGRTRDFDLPPLPRPLVLCRSRGASGLRTRAPVRRMKCRWRYVPGSVTGTLLHGEGAFHVGVEDAVVRVDPRFGGGGEVAVAGLGDGVERVACVRGD